MIPGLILKMSCFHKYLLIYSPPSTNSGWYTQNCIPTCVLVRVKLGSVPFNSCKCPSELRYTVFSTTAISSICSHSRLVGPCFYMVGSRDQRTQIWKGAIKESFQQSLVDIGSVVSKEKIFFKFHPPFFLICIIGQNRQKFKVHKKSCHTC